MASGMRDMKMSLIYEIRKCLIAYKRAGRGCGDRFIQLFCRTAAIPLPDFTNLWVKFSTLQWGILISDIKIPLINHLENFPCR